MTTVITHHCAQAVEQFISMAQFKLDIAVCWFTHPILFRALERAIKKGVHVRIVLNYDQVNFHPGALDFLHLVSRGAHILALNGTHLLHSKYAIADHSRVLLGSFNWTQSEHQETMLDIEDILLAKKLGETFDDYLKKCTPLLDLAGTTPKSVHFHQLHQPQAWTSYHLRKLLIAGAKCWQIRVDNERAWENMRQQQQYIAPLKKGVLLPWEEGAWLPDCLLESLEQMGISRNAKALLMRFCVKVKQGDIIVAFAHDQKLLGAGVVASEPEYRAGSFARFVQWLPSKTDLRLSGPSPRGVLSPFRGAGMAVVSAL